MFCINDCRTVLRLFKGGGVIGYGLCLKATERYEYEKTIERSF